MPATRPECLFYREKCCGTYITGNISKFCYIPFKVLDDKIQHNPTSKLADCTLNTFGHYRRGSILVIYCIPRSWIRSFRKSAKWSKSSENGTLSSENGTFENLAKSHPRKIFKENLAVRVSRFKRSSFSELCSDLAVPCSELCNDVTVPFSELYSNPYDKYPFLALSSIFSKAKMKLTRTSVGTDTIRTFRPTFMVLIFFLEI